MAGLGQSSQLSVTNAPGSGNGSVHITATGELDLASAAQLSEAVRRVLSAEPVSELTLDLSEVSFIDSTGLRALIEVEREVAHRQAALTVVPAPQPVTELLQLAGLASRLGPAADGQTPPSESDFLERADLQMAAGHDAPSRARATLREVLEGVLDGAGLAGVVLMTSELVTNAVLHSSAPEAATVGLTILIYPGHLRVEVDDLGPGFDPAEHLAKLPAVPGPGEGGRGLFVIDQLAKRWGSRYRQADDGRRFSVWFEAETS